MYRILAACLTALPFALPAQAGDQTPDVMATIATADGAEIGSVAVTYGSSGNGIVTLTLSGLTEGDRAVHFHTSGLCEAPDFTSAGGHLAGEHSHGVLTAEGPHIGDMPNLHVPAGGALKVTYFVPGLTEAAVNDTDGTALIVHQGTDDYASQPTGEAGGRLACAVIAPQQ